MSTVERARSAFVQRAATLYQRPPSEPRVVTSPDVEVPGFTAFEAGIDETPVRGWARDDGTVVLAPVQEFGPILDAVHLRDDAATMAALDIASRLVWAHGPDHQLIERVEAGELGAREAIDLPARRSRRPDGAIELRFGMKVLDPDDPAIVEVVIVGRSDGTYRLDISQLAPPSDDRDDD